MKDILLWLLYRRKALESKQRGVSIHWTARVDNSSVLWGYNNIGRRVRINSSEIGRATYIAADTKINSSKIGRFCSIGHETLIGGLSKHPTNWRSTHPAFFSSRKQANFSFTQNDKIQEIGSVEIGNDVWIGARAIILDGVNVGHGSVIGAGAVVSKNVPPYAIVGGVPARVIKYRFNAEKINHLLNERWWDLSLDEISTLDPGPWIE